MRCGAKLRGTEEQSLRQPAVKLTCRRSPESVGRLGRLRLTRGESEQWEEPRWEGRGWGWGGEEEEKRRIRRRRRGKKRSAETRGKSGGEKIKRKKGGWESRKLLWAQHTQDQKEGETPTWCSNVATSLSSGPAPPPQGRQSCAGTPENPYSQVVIKIQFRPFRFWPQPSASLFVWSRSYRRLVHVFTTRVNLFSLVRAQRNPPLDWVLMQYGSCACRQRSALTLVEERT